MKTKLFYTLSLVALCLSSCSNDEVVETNKTAPIQFANAYVGKITRTVDPSFTTETLGEFGVYGWVTNNGTTGKIFDNEAVTSTDAGKNWTYANTQYWIAGGTYDFAAVAPKGNGTHAIVSASDAKITGFTSNGATDLVFATSTGITGKTSGNSAVQLNFKHQLSKIKLTFKNSIAENANIALKVTDVKITDAYETGDVTLSSVVASTTPPTWSNQAGELELTLGNVVDDNSETATLASSSSLAANNELLLIPSADTKAYTVTFNVSLIQSGVEFDPIALTAKISGIELKGGYAYNFTATLTESNVNGNDKLEPIEFAVSGFEEWIDTSGDASVESKSQAI